MLCFSNSNVLTHRLKFKTKVFLHWTLQVAAGICITGGLVSAVIRKIQRDKSHFKSYHAIFGLIAIILSLLTMLNGIPTKYSYRLRRNIRPVFAKIGHATLSLITYGVAVVALILGLYTGWFRHYGSPTMFYVCWLVLMFITQYIVYNPTVTLVNRVRGVMRKSRQLN